MNAPRSLIVASMLTLTGCATPTIQVQDCGSPPQLPESVTEQANRPQQTFSERGKPLLQLFETLIERR